MTGTSAGRKTRRDYATVAYSSGTGRQLWVSRYSGPGNGDDGATTVDVSQRDRGVRDRERSAGQTGGYDYATVAYGVGTGRQLWVRRYNVSVTADSAGSMAVSRDGSRVFVTGTSGARRVAETTSRSPTGRDRPAAVGQPLQRPRDGSGAYSVAVNPRAEPQCS